VPPRTRIQSTSLAPLLSATLNLDSCCIMLFSFLYDFNQSPSLRFAKRTSFHYFYNVTNLCFVVFIVSMEFFGFLYEFSILRMFQFTYYSDSDSFLHFVTRNYTCSGFTLSSYYFAHST